MSVFVAGLKEMTLKVLNCMSSFISLPAIIQHILQVCICGFGLLFKQPIPLLGKLRS